MEYLTLKSIHIFSAILLFGTGLGSAFYKFFADRSGETAAQSVTNRLVVAADWLFTTPTIIIQPVTGFWMLALSGLPLDSLWVWVSVVLYLIAGACWLPVVWLQIRMRRLSAEAVAERRLLSAEYWRLARLWFWLGIPAFIAMVMVTGLMVYKPV